MRPSKRSASITLVRLPPGTQASSVSGSCSRRNTQSGSRSTWVTRERLNTKRLLRPWSAACLCCMTELDMCACYTTAQDRMSVADAQAFDVDLVCTRCERPCEMRQRAGGRSVENPSIECELRPVAGANEVLLAIVEGVGATEVWACDGERLQRSLVASQEAAKSRIAGSVHLATIGHDESHSRRRVEARCGALLQICDGSGQLHANFPLAAIRPTGRKDVNRDRSHHRGQDRGQQDPDPPTQKSSAGGGRWFRRVDAHGACNYGAALQPRGAARQTTKSSICPSFTRTGIFGRVAGADLSR